MGVIFSLYNPFHPGIVEQVVSRLITRSPVAVMFLSLLRKITVDRPRLAAEIVPRLKEALEYDQERKKERQDITYISNDRATM
jgi:hypothetical protein